MAAGQAGSCWLRLRLLGITSTLLQPKPVPEGTRCRSQVAVARNLGCWLRLRLPAKAGMVAACSSLRDGKKEKLGY